MIKPKSILGRANFWILVIELVALTPAIVVLSLFYGLLLVFTAAGLVAPRPENPPPPLSEILFFLSIATVAMVSLAVLFSLLVIHILNFKVSPRVLKFLIAGLAPGMLFSGAILYYSFMGKSPGEFRFIQDSRADFILYGIPLLGSVHLTVLTFLQIRRFAKELPLPNGIEQDRK